ncbi:hypothetical protein TNCV_2886881 [Trichonephila clavipes]|nr:hypothetical protein TNCV_2886881 [Trichonephila clavipes]
MLDRVLPLEHWTHPNAGQSPSGRNLFSVRSMLSGLDAELCPASGLCPVSKWQNSVQRQGYFQCPGSRNLSCVRGMSSYRVAEICPGVGICSVA